jgi:hypothetical protein
MAAVTHHGLCRPPARGGGRIAGVQRQPPSDTGSTQTGGIDGAAHDRRLASVVESNSSTRRSSVRECDPDMEETLLRDTVPLVEVQLESDLTYEEKPIKIIETAERVTRTKTIKFCKVQWNHHTKEEATWEQEDDLRENHPHLFASRISGSRFILRG